MPTAAQPEPRDSFWTARSLCSRSSSLLASRVLEPGPNAEWLCYALTNMIWPLAKKKKRLAAEGGLSLVLRVFLVARNLVFFLAAPIESSFFHSAAVRVSSRRSSDRDPSASIGRRIPTGRPFSNALVRSTATSDVPTAVGEPSEDKGDDDDKVDYYDGGFKINMPALSKSMSKGRVVMWLKDEGDYVEPGDAIVVVDTDKADVEMEMHQSGYLAQILVQEGETASVGDPIALVAIEESDAETVVDVFRRDKESLRDSVSAGR